MQGDVVQAHVHIILVYISSKGHCLEAVVKPVGSCNFSVWLTRATSVFDTMIWPASAPLFISKIFAVQRPQGCFPLLRCTQIGSSVNYKSASAISLSALYYASLYQLRVGSQNI